MNGSKYPARDRRRSSRFSLFSMDVLKDHFSSHAREKYEYSAMQRLFNNALHRAQDQ
ncbi:hypothetical protein GF325_05430 [Candidatus Bathyarchaeota archaeon]|nr:hypothetical protein [Candidatus Bathyarchaeota archaeon]